MAHDIAGMAPPALVRQAGLQMGGGMAQRRRPTPLITKEASGKRLSFGIDVRSLTPGRLVNGGELTPGGLTPSGRGQLTPSGRGQLTPGGRVRSFTGMGTPTMLMNGKTVFPGTPTMLNGKTVFPPSGKPMAGRQLPTPTGEPMDLSLPLGPVIKQLSRGSDRKLPGTPTGSPPNARPNLPKSNSTSSIVSGSPAKSAATRTLSGHSLTAARGQEAGAQAMRRRVNFCPTPQNSCHAVTPYGLKYGKHPSFFDFDRKGEMQLTDAGVVDEMRHGDDSKE